MAIFFLLFYFAGLASGRLAHIGMECFVSSRRGLDFFIWFQFKVGDYLPIVILDLGNNSFTT